MDVSLTEAVASLRDELLAAASLGRGQQLTFEVGPIEMEFEVELRVEGTAGMDARVCWVVRVHGDVSGSRSSTHRVKLTLNPKNKDGSKVSLAGGADRVDGPGDVTGDIGD
jgi:Trypsin-co-occurring domain 2